MYHPNDQKKDKSKKEQRLRRNLVFSASTVVFAVLVLIFYVISNLPALSDFMGKIFSILSPVIGGAALAYLCNPILNFFEKHLFRRIKSPDVKRMLGIFCTYFFLILVIAAIGLLIIPQLINSVKALIAQYENYIANAVTGLNAFITRVMQNLPFESPEGSGQEFISLDKVNALLETLVGSVGNLFNVLLENIQSYGAKLFSTISNVILSLFISFYLLVSKETRLAQLKKLTTALFNEKRNKFIYETASRAHTAFGSFLGGKLLDALIVGIVYFILFSIFGIPYAPMLATILGVMNIIPFFGPLIGAIPTAFIVLISAPEKIILFVILVLIVGQIDGNIIEPKILGDRTGVSSLCVIIAISVMGNLWGVFGMIIGVPLFAVVIALIEQFANAKLAKKGLSQDLDDYYDDDDEYAYESIEGVRLSKRYYKDKLIYRLTPKARRGKKPCREDYLIYPPEPQQDDTEYANEPVDEPIVEACEEATGEDTFPAPSSDDMPIPNEPVLDEDEVTDENTDDETAPDDDVSDVDDMDEIDNVDDIEDIDEIDEVDDTETLAADDDDSSKTE
jgi:predicted PurR-regulated permease PerM